MQGAHGYFVRACVEKGCLWRRKWYVELGGLVAKQESWQCCCQQKAPSKEQLMAREVWDSKICLGRILAIPRECWTGAG